MIEDITATKIVVRDVDVAERFYAAIGLTVVSRNVGGDGAVWQKQVWLAASLDPSAHKLILSQFLGVPAPPMPDYPREFWLAFRVEDVDRTIAAIREAGRNVLREAEDRPEHEVRAAVVTDPEGHIIELVGSMTYGG